MVSTNQFTARKTAAQALMDVALMMANISQLRTLLTVGPDKMDYFYVLTVLVAMSLVCQVFFAILIFVIWMRESDHDQREEFLKNIQQVCQVDTKKYQW